MNNPLQLVVKQQGPLLEFLFNNVKGSKTTIKSYLRNRQVSINHIPTTQFDAELKPGDKVVVDFSMQKPGMRSSLVKLLYEDDEIIVVSKREGLLSIATDREKTRTAYNIVSDYVKQFNPDARIFIVHRLDRETSGVIIFAKSINVQHALQYNWEERVVDRKYYAVVEGVMNKDEDTVETYLTETKALKVVATLSPIGKIAKTYYKVLKRGTHFTLLELHLQTGRKNQIRAHMSYLGHPIAGDKKYGAKTDPIRRVALHAGLVEVLHPKTEEQMSFSTDIPKSFDIPFQKLKKQQ